MNGNASQHSSIRYILKLFHPHPTLTTVAVLKLYLHSFRVVGKWNSFNMYLIGDPCVCVFHVFFSLFLMAHTAAAFLADDEEQRASIFFMFTSKWHMDK